MESRGFPQCQTHLGWHFGDVAPAAGTQGPLGPLETAAPPECGTGIHHGICRWVGQFWVVNWLKGGVRGLWEEQPRAGEMNNAVMRELNLSCVSLSPP